MNADGRRWICGSLFIAMGGAGLVATAHSEEFHSQLGAEIQRRFQESAIDIDGASLEFGCKFSQYITSRMVLRGFLNDRGESVVIRPNFGQRFLEEPASLPKPTLVESRIARGFPSGESSERANRQARDNSYHLAERDYTFRGVRFSR